MKFIGQAVRGAGDAKPMSKLEHLCKKLDAPQVILPVESQQLMLLSMLITEVQAQPALERHETQIMSIPGVAGMGIGECDEHPCIKVFVEVLTPELKDQIPKDLEGVKVDIEETGPFEIQSE